MEDLVKTYSVTDRAKLEVLNAIQALSSEEDLKEFKDLVAKYFANKAQKAIDALWENGAINEKTIESWGEEHLRTPYHYATHRS